MSARHLRSLLGSLVTATALLVSGGCSTQATDSAEASSAATTPSESENPAEGRCGPVDPDQELTTLVVSNSSGGLTEAYIAWGDKEGCFSKHGLAIDSVPAGGVDKVAGLVGGSLDVAAENVMTLVLTRGNSDIDLRILSGHYAIGAQQIDRAKETPELANGKLIIEVGLFVSPDWQFDTLSDLRGARIAAGAGVGPTQLGLLRALTGAGLSETDIELIPLNSSEGLATLLAGEVDGANLAGVRAYQALDAGYRLVLYPGAYFYEPSVVQGWLTTGDIAEQKRDELLAFKAAMIDIYRLLEDSNAAASFISLLESDFDFDAKALSQFTFPPLMTTDIESAELQYLADNLFAEGLIDRELTLSDDILVR